MKAEELRIGNWVIDVDGNWQITLSDFYNMYLDDDCPFKPIPITEEWLLKFGYQKLKKCNVYDFYRKENNDFEISISEDGKFSFYNPCHECSVYIDLNYIHQLQNLYFALTNEELTII